MAPDVGPPQPERENSHTRRKRIAADADPGARLFCKVRIAEGKTSQNHCFGCTSKSTPSGPRKTRQASTRSVHELAAAMSSAEGCDKPTRSCQRRRAHSQTQQQRTKQQ